MRLSASAVQKLFAALAFTTLTGSGLLAAGNDYLLCQQTAIQAHSLADFGPNTPPNVVLSALAKLPTKGIVVAKFPTETQVARSDFWAQTFGEFEVFGKILRPFAVWKYDGLRLPATLAEVNPLVVSLFQQPVPAHDFSYALTTASTLNSNVTAYWGVGVDEIRQNVGVLLKSRRNAVFQFDVNSPWSSSYNTRKVTNNNPSGIVWGLYCVHMK